MKRYIVVLWILVVLGACCGCSTGIRRVSGIVENAFDASYREVCDMALMIRVRENACDCDPELKYEAEVYGEWRHVHIIGSNGALSAMQSAVEKNGEYCFYLKDDVYISKHGQQFYQIEACEILEWKTLLSH